MAGSSPISAVGSSGIVAIEVRAKPAIITLSDPLLGYAVWGLRPWGRRRWRCATGRKQANWTQMVSEGLTMFAAGTATGSRIKRNPPLRALRQAQEGGRKSSTCRSLADSLG